MTLTPQTLFVWVSYGTVNIYLIDTKEKLEILRQFIYNTCVDLDYNGVITGIDDMIDDIGGVGCHESFEYGTGWNKLK